MPSGPSDEFDKIVENLDIEIEFPAEEVPPVDDASTPDDVAHPSGATNEQPTLPHASPPNRKRTLAWIAVLGAPGLLVLATVLGFVLPRSIVFAAALIFVAGAIYLISTLPEHGPGRPDWPDDGAVL